MASRKGSSLLSELKKNTEILEMTFEKAGLQVIQTSWKEYGDNGWLEFYIEVTGDPEKMQQDRYVHIKVNLYDEEGDILTMDDGLIVVERFSGYETLNISFYEDGLLSKASKARVFAVRS